MRYKLAETAPPATLPVTMDDIKLHLRISHSADDDLIEGIVATATLMCEQFTGMSLVNRTYAMTIDSWPQKPDNGWWDGVREGAGITDAASEILLPRPPLASVNSITVFDENDDGTVYSAENYFADTGIPGRVVLKSSPPTPARNAAGIVISFTAGYGEEAEDVPAPLRQAVRQITAHLYENRGDTTDAAFRLSGAQTLLQPFRRMGGF